MTRIQVGLELNNEGRAVAWALDYPGCFAYGSDGPQAIVALAPALVRYQQWVNQHAGQEQLDLGDFDLRLVDTWTVFSMDDDYNITDEGYAVDAWFKHDWKPLTAEDVARGLQLLEWSRADLQKTADAIDEEQMEARLPGERWSIRGILRHVANAEWWYLDRFGLAGGPRESLPAGIFERLAEVRSRLTRALPGMVGKEWVIGKEGEFWSPRKLLRRVLWHEINHRDHIQKVFLRL